MNKLLGSFRGSAEFFSVRKSTLFLVLVALLVVRIVITFLSPPEKWEELVTHLLEASMMAVLVLLLTEILWTRSGFDELAHRESERYFESPQAWVFSTKESVLRQAAAQEDLYAFLVAASLGWDVQAIPMRRFVPVRLYIREGSSEAEAEKIFTSISDYFKRLGFSIANEFPAERGSWFKRWVAKSKEALTQDEVLERLKKAERALELATLQIKQSEVDRNQAEAASKLLESLADVSEAVCQIGSILVVKQSDSDGKKRVFTRSLTSAEMMYLERHQDLLRSPERILESISTGAAEQKLVSEAVG